MSYRDNLYTYKLKLTALSPIHIGTGEDYEPTSFVIERDTFYHFDEELFYKSLNPLDKKTFDGKLSDWMQMIDFYKANTSKAITISKFSCNVSSKVSERYRLLKNRDGSKNNNSFQIAQTFKNPNTFRAIISGSSIKGMLDTVLQIYPKKIKDTEPRQKLILSDALILNGGTVIGYSYRKHKIPSKEAKSNIPQIVETIKVGSSFIATIKMEYTFTELKQQMKKYHNERYDSQYVEDEKSFVARIGKYNGKEYMVDDGRNVLNSYDKPIATHTLYEDNDQPFGWLKFELISDEEYKKSLLDIKQQEIDYFNDLTTKQKEILEAINKAKIDAQKIVEAREQKRAQEAKEVEEKRKAEEERLSQLSPLELLMDEIIQKASGQSPIAALTAALNGDEVPDGLKCDFAKNLKIRMETTKGEWVPSGNPAKDKAAKRTQVIMKILESC